MRVVWVDGRDWIHDDVPSLQMVYVDRYWLVSPRPDPERRPSTAVRPIQPQPEPGELLCRNRTSSILPSHTVPGVKPSADPVLQNRLFSCPDTHRHRLGVNHQQIPVNAPLPTTTSATAACPSMATTAPTPAIRPRTATRHPSPSKSPRSTRKWAGAAVAQRIPITGKDVIQPSGLWEVLGRTPRLQNNFVHNVAGHLSAAKELTRASVRTRCFTCIDKTLGARIAEETEKLAPALMSRAVGSAGWSQLVSWGDEG